jgi:GTPase SAR1 family protein
MAGGETLLDDKSKNIVAWLWDTDVRDTPTYFPCWKLPQGKGPQIHCFVICFAVQSKKQKEALPGKWREIKALFPDTPFILAGMRADMRETPWTADECLSAEAAAQLAKEISANSYMECSSLNGTGVRVV